VAVSHFVFRSLRKLAGGGRRGCFSVPDLRVLSTVVALGMRHRTRGIRNIPANLAIPAWLESMSSSSWRSSDHDRRQ